jgi:pilus assembly protein CpaB
MEASSTSGRIGGKWPALSGRRSGVIIAVVAAVLAGVLLYAFVQHYKKSTPTAAVSTTTAVIVSTGFIPTGTPASQVALGDGLQHMSVPSSVALPGAISDSAAITGEVAAKNIYPGHQITAADFTTGDVTIAQYLSPGERAIEIPIDATHGLQGYVLPGNRIDLLTNAGAAGKETILASNVQVLSIGTGTNGEAESTGSGSLVLAVSQAMAAKLAAAADSSSIWVLLRPPVWSKPSPSATTGK